MIKIYLLSDDLVLIGRWMKLINYETNIVENLEDLQDIMNSILIVNSSVCKDISPKFINDFIKNANQILVLDNTPNLINAKRFLSLVKHINQGNLESGLFSSGPCSKAEVISQKYRD